MSWTKTILYSLGLSVAFFFYFALFVVSKWSIWAIHEFSPILQIVKAEHGQPYFRALGYAVAFAVGVLCTTAFLFPLRYAFTTMRKLLVSVAIVIAPVVAVDARGLELSLLGISIFMQPVVGALLAILAFQFARRRSLRNGDFTN